MERRPETELSTERRSRGRPFGFGPFSLMRRLSEDMDRMLDDFFVPNLSPWANWPRQLAPSGAETLWPNIEVEHKGDKLVVQADVPGLKKEDVQVEIFDNELCISGERRSEHERTEGGYYRSERSYGSFCRSVPLPEGAKPETASATFDNGVLRIEIEAPADQGRGGRRVEVREGSPH